MLTVPRIFQCALALAGALLGWPALGAAEGGRSTPERTVYLRLAGRRFSLDSVVERNDLVATVQRLIERAKAEDTARRSLRRAMASRKPMADFAVQELWTYHHEPDAAITSRERRGLKELERWVSAVGIESGRDQGAPAHRMIHEIAAALNNNRRSPAPGVLEFFRLPFVLWDYHHNPVSRGKEQAANLERNPGAIEDGGLADPSESTFWRRPEAVGAQDLYCGFGRSRLPPYSEVLWTYDGPKTSYGGNAGFDARAGTAKIKVKFAETTSEPLTARIFAALGYHVDATDHAAYLKVRYDRRLLREFHLRKEVKTQIRLLWVFPLHTIDLQRRFDPFEFIREAVLRDGSRLTPQELKTRLFHRLDLPHPEDDPANFDQRFEAQIEYLVTVPANVQQRNEDVDSLGPWDFNQLGHGKLRELRGAGLLAAWLGWFDSRFENTRLKRVETAGTVEFRHYFTDLGGGLGDAVGPTSRRAETPNDFGWIFTRRPRQDPNARLRIFGFQPIEDTRPFKEMTLADARWMARLIGQLTERQLAEALVASGFESAQVRLYLEKLISRRDRMIRDVGLANEIGLLRPEGVNRTISYDPAAEGPVSLRAACGEEGVAPAGNSVLREGRIARRERAR